MTMGCKYIWIRKSEFVSKIMIIQSMFGVSGGSKGSERDCQEWINVV